MKTADWIIDLGPEGGDGGGQIVATGTPEQIAAIEGNATGRFLRRRLPRVSKVAGTLRVPSANYKGELTCR